MVYITQEANHIKSMQALLDIGELCYDMSQVAVMCRQFDINYDTGMGDIYSINEIKLMINQIQIQQNNLILDYNSWSYCKSSDVIENDLIPYITYENPSKMLYANLYQFTDMFIKNVIII